MSSDKQTLPRWLIIALATTLPVVVGLISLYAHDRSIFGSLQTLALVQVDPVPFAITFSIPYWQDLIFLGVACGLASVIATSRPAARLLERLKKKEASLGNLGLLLLGEFLFTLILATFVSGLCGVFLTALIAMSVSLIFGLVFGGLSNALPAKDRKGLVTYPFSGSDRFLATCVSLSVLSLVHQIYLAIPLTLAFILTGTGPIVAAITATIVSALAGLTFFIGLLPGLAVLVLRVAAAKTLTKP